METRIGEIVHLNSGSPDLAVTGVDQNKQTAMVEWRDEQGETHNSEFPLACLMLQSVPELSRYGNSACLGCGQHLAYCGSPFSADIKCRKCGAINVYEDSQQPKRIASEGRSQKGSDFGRVVK